MDEYDRHRRTFTDIAHEASGLAGAHCRQKMRMRFLVGKFDESYLECIRESNAFATLQSVVNGVFYFSKLFVNL